MNIPTNTRMIGLVLSVAATATVFAGPELSDLDTYVTIPSVMKVRNGKVTSSTPVVTNTVEILEALGQNDAYAKENISTLSNRTSMVLARDGSDPQNTYIDKNGVPRKDYRVVIGEGTVNDGNDSDHGQSVTIGRDSRAHGPATTSLGPNTEGSDDGFNINIGWRTISTKKGGISIGTGLTSNQDYWLDEGRTEHNPKEGYTAATGVNAISIGRGTRAEADNAISLGAGAKSTAVNAVQLGAGTNDEPDTLKYKNVVLVKDGKLVENFTAASLDPVCHDASTEEEVSARSHAINTIAASKKLTGGEEIGLTPTSSRNFDVFFPNDENVRGGLPVWLKLEVDGATPIIRGRSNSGLEYLTKLPAMIQVRQPMTNLVMFTVDYIENNYDWTPVITNTSVSYNSTDNRFVLIGERPKVASGYNLHAATEITIEYPTVDDETTATVNVGRFNETSKCIDGTLFSNASIGEEDIGKPTVLPDASYFDGTKSFWFIIHYTTRNGTGDYRVSMSPL